jgi:hypothetical protein
MKQTKPAQAMELRSLSPVFDGQMEERGRAMTAHGDIRNGGSPKRRRKNNFT